MSVVMVGMSQQRYYQTSSHTHSLWEIVLNTEGQGVTTIGGREYPFSAGTIICQPPDMLHSKASTEGFHDIYLQTNTLLLGRKADAGGVIIFADDAAKTFENLLQIAHRIYHKRENNYQNILDALYEAMCRLLLSWHGDTVQDKDYQVELLKNQIIQSFTDPDFIVGPLLDNAPLSKDHLRRRFAQEAGCTPLEYLTELRIGFAQKLLRENHLLHHSIGEIAVMSGYYDSHYFSRLFKQKTGLSPTEYAGRGRGA